MYKRIVKRLLDIVVSGSGIIFSFLVLIIAIAILVDDPGPVFFKQKRIARDSASGEKQYFQILKFRTMKMTAPSDVPTHLLENPEQHLTKVGKFLRKTSLDELPQLLNIFVGQMSIVGPRPALWNQED
ncbi:MAG: sugar transferase, partial [Fastidiosipila sp.]|nr:sugar transferase [Fastidiosipila sp.]